MSEDTALSSIEQIRGEIDSLDVQLVKLLNERASKSLEIRNLKPEARMGLFDPKREEEIFEKVTDLNEGPLYSDDICAIYATILKVSKEMHG